MIKIYLVLTLLLCLTSFSYAGIVKENGGNTVICKLDSGKKSVVLLDFFEAEQLMIPDQLHFTHLVGKEKKQVLSEVLQFIRWLSDSKFNQYSRWLSEFEGEAAFLKGVKLDIIPDSYHFIIPSYCSVNQTVIQIEPLFHEARYTIDQDLWDQLTPADQTGLQMHELIYRDLSAANDSRNVRLINAFLFSDEIRLLSRQQVIDILKKLGLNKSAW